MNKTHPIQHVILGLNVAWAFWHSNVTAGIAWGTAWALMFVCDWYIAKIGERMKTLELFAAAYKGKWPSKEAQDAAAVQLQAWKQGQ